MFACRVGKPGARDLKPPDLWIHDRVMGQQQQQQRRTSHASNSAVSSTGGGGGAASLAGSASQDANDDSRELFAAQKLVKIGYDTIRYEMLF